VGSRFVVQAAEQTAHPISGPRRRPGNSSTRRTQIGEQPIVDDGGELFGTTTDQPKQFGKNGFTALAVFDAPSAGGNGDGAIGPSDQVWAFLRIWVDINHDGVSQQNELLTLADAGIALFSLDYQRVGRKDEHGNYFRYRAKVVRAAGHEIWAWDVFPSAIR
jgi:hypothetical protein